MARRTGRKPTAAERRAHDIIVANLFPDTAGKRADLAPCARCGTRDHDGALVPAHITEHGTAGYCAACERAAWGRAAHEQAFWLEDPACYGAD
jgi:hypothetical protein